MPLASDSRRVQGTGPGAGEGLASAAGRSCSTRAGADALNAVADGLPGGVTAIAGDVADSWHRAALAAAVRDHGRLDCSSTTPATWVPARCPAWPSIRWRSWPGCTRWT